MEQRNHGGKRFLGARLWTAILATEATVEWPASGLHGFLPGSTVGHGAERTSGLPLGQRPLGWTNGMDVLCKR